MISTQSKENNNPIGAPGAAIKRNYRATGAAIRRQIYKFGKQAPIYNMGQSPFYAGSAAKRSQTYAGFKEIFGTKTKAGGGAAYGRIEAVLAKSDPKKAARLQSYASRIGAFQKAGTSTGTLVAEARQLMPEMMRTNAKRGVKGLTSSFLSGTSDRGMFKAYQHAILNPRTLAIGGAMYAIGKGTMAAEKYAENFFTENRGRGRFGTDTRNQLGPASLKGLRFRTTSRKRTI